MTDKIKTALELCGVVTLTIGKGEGKRELTVDPRLAHETWLAKVIEYGVRRFPNDTYSAMKGDTKVDAIRAMLRDMESGEELVQRVRVASAPSDPVAFAAGKAAKADLLIVFRMRTEKTKIADMAGADDAVAAYFVKREDGSFVWKEDAIAAFIVKQKEAGKRDYMADAELLGDVAI